MGVPPLLARGGGRRPQPWRLLRALLLCAAALATPARGATATPTTSTSSSPSSTPMPPPSPVPLVYPPGYSTGTPTTVWASWTWNRLGEINPVDGTFSVDGYLSLAWVDPRLNSTFPLQWAGSSGLPSTSNFFVPWPEFVNEEFQLLNNPPIWQAYMAMPPYATAPSVLSAYNVSTAAEVAALTWVNLYGRCAATYYSSFSLAAFPFDYQKVPFSIESVAWDDSMVVFRSAPDAFDINAGAVARFDAVLSPNLYVPGFSVLYGYSEVTSTWYPAWQLYYSRWSAVAYVQRNSHYYLRKSILNIILLVCMSVGASLLRPNDPSRAMVQVTLFLGIVSWVFVLSNDSPRTGSTTVMDEFINASFATMFTLYIYHCIVAISYHRQGKAKRNASEGAAAAAHARATLGATTPSDGEAATAPPVHHRRSMVDRCDFLTRCWRPRAPPNPVMHGRPPGLRIELPGTSRAGGMRQRPQARLASLPGANLRAASVVHSVAPSRPPAQRILNLDTSGDGPARLVCCGFKSNLRALDVVVTSIVFTAYGSAVAGLLTPGTAQPQPPRPG